MNKHSCLILFLVILLTSCKKDKLPEPTQEGKNTFGCLVDGKLFREASGLSSPGSPRLSVQYLSTTKGNQENILSIGTPGKIEDIESPYVGFGIGGLTVEKGKTYILAADEKVGAAAIYRAGGVRNSVEYLTSSSQKGELYISRIDDKGVSGTFWFDAISKTGQKVEIRDGRFDVNF
jgi:hypothetical protein